MRLSNKSTFSLASLILLLALGVVFGTTFVMAHPHTDNTTTPLVDESDVDHQESHHPMATITLTPANAATFMGKSIEGTSVRLLNSADVDHDGDNSNDDIVKGGRFAETRADASGPLVIVQDDNGMFKLRITFSQDLDTADALEQGDITLTVVGSTTPQVDTSAWVQAPAFVADDADTTDIDESKRVIEAEVFVPAAQYVEMPMTVYASVNLGIVGSNGVSTPAQVIDGKPVASLPNLASDPLDAVFMVVPILPSAPAAGPATLTATAGQRGEVVLTWALVTGATSYQYSTDDTTFVDVPNSDATTTTYTVTGLGDNASLMFYVRGKNSIGTGPSASDSVTTIDGPDMNPPTVTITHELDDTSGDVTFTFEFNEPVVFASGHVDVDNGTKGAFTALATPNVFELVVTPEADKKVRVSIAEDTVLDANNNALAATEPNMMGATYTPDGYIPTIAIASEDGTGDNAGKIIFTLNFSDVPSPFRIGQHDIDVTNSKLITLADLVVIEFPGEGYASTYELTVEPKDTTMPVTLTIQAGAIMTAENPPQAFEAAEDDHRLKQPPVPAMITDPADPANAGNTTAGGKVTVTFDRDPGLVSAMIGTTSLTVASGTVDKSVDITIPADQAVGFVPIALEWTGTDSGTSDDGSGTVTYTIPADENPTSPVNISNRITIPANSYVMVVRDKAAAISSNQPIGQRFSRITDDITGDRIIPDAKIMEWSKMPNLAALFDRDAPGGGGALVLRKVVDDANAPAIGTVGISEIMTAIDVGYIGQTRARNSQWIELHNLNDTAKTVLIYAQTGAQFTDPNKVVTKTQAGDTIHGHPGGMVVDVITNYFTGDNRGTDGWDIPSPNNGSSKVGIDFVSMARKGTFAIGRQNDDKNNYTGLYTKTTIGQSGRDKDQTGSSDGRHPGSWEASTVSYDRYATVNPDAVTTDVPATYDILGTPGRPNTYTSATHITEAKRTSVPIDSVYFNEIANRNDVNKEYEWIELRNESNTEINLRNYLISIVTAVDSEKVLYQFPTNDKAKIPGKGVFLLVASDPRDNPSHPLAVGYNVDLDDEDQVTGTRKNPVRYKVADVGGVPGFGNGRNAGESVTSLPDDGKFVLILRRPDTTAHTHLSGAHGGEGVAERGNADLDKVLDVAGWNPDLGKANYPNAVSSTNLWPLYKFEKLDFNRNQFVVERVHYRRSRVTKGSHNDDRAAWDDAPYTGIGYKRRASDSWFHGGSPGYHANTTGKAADNKVIISEIMLSQGERGNLPQWIELYNPSKTHAVDLADTDDKGAGWRLVIENPGKPIITINFRDKGNVKVIPPNQTVLIVSSSAGDYGGDDMARSAVFPSTRVLNAFTAIRGETFELASRTDPLLDPAGFNLRLMDGKTSNNKPDGRYTGEVSDEIGSLDGNARTNDEPAWEFPSGMTEDGDRTSLIRNFVEGVAQDGMMAENWTRAVDTGGLAQLYVRHTWYGDETDYGTPANRAGSVLPVSLSHFRPTLEDGKVVVRWTTESELDNAGFNILRSDSRNGEFAQVNDKLIQGKGTTGERSTYSWVDATAKPGVVYYYQIEDVSFAGERQTLRTTKLKGYISAENKLTTTWGDLKEVQ